MQLLIDNGAYAALNVGDIALLQTAWARLATAWPGAVGHVLTRAPDRLAALCPCLLPVPAEGKDQFLRPASTLPGARLLPTRLAARLGALEVKARFRWPRITGGWLAWRRAQRGLDPEPVRAFLQAMLPADAIIATGGGYITDVFADHAMSVLRLFAFAKALGKPVAAFSQGIGPIESPALRALAGKILPQVDLIAVREGHQAPAVLESLGVAADRVVVTGDDAIELAYSVRSAALGDSLGLNVRVASYAALDGQRAGAVWNAVRRFARAHGVPAVAVPISEHRDLPLLRDWLRCEFPRSCAFRSPLRPDAVARQTAQCRVVVTGSYHAGVFALAQGVPVVAVAGSRYYWSKFTGLARQFGTGCQIIDAGRDDLEQRLTSAIHLAWEAAPAVRDELLRRAAAQIGAAEAAYRRFQRIVELRGRI